jgi:hypothetical protein
VARPRVAAETTSVHEWLAFAASGLTLDSAEKQFDAVHTLQCTGPRCDASHDSFIRKSHR